MVALQGYQRQRIITLFDPESDPLGADEHHWSTTAIGSGGLFGKGLLQGTQSHLDFLPEARTDFIIAVVGEELGLVGVVFLLLMYLCIIARGLVLAVSAQSTFARYCRRLNPNFFIVVRQHRHGQRAVAGSGCAATPSELRWYQSLP